MGKMKRELKKNIKNKKYDPNEPSMFNTSIKPLSHFMKLVIRRMIEYTFNYGEMLSHIWAIIFNLASWLLLPISVPLIALLLKLDHSDECIRVLSKAQSISYKEAKKIYKYLRKERKQHYE